MNGAQLAVEAQHIRPDLKVLLTSGYAASALAEDHGLPETLEVLRALQARRVGKQTAADYRRCNRLSCHTYLH